VDTAKGLMEHDELRTRYAANARAYAERSFDIARIADRFLDVIASTRPLNSLGAPVESTDADRASVAGR
jgi:hypothetical protein